MASSSSPPKTFRGIATTEKENSPRIEIGLTAEGGNIPMNVTWVMGFPSGNEQGKFLTLDMGGTNLRVCQVALTDGRGQYEIIQSKYQMPESLKSGTADELWGFIADCTATFIQENRLAEGLSNGKLPVSFTFSFPVTQPTIQSGILQRWTKDFDVDGVEGHDVVPQLGAALEKRNVPVKIIAVVNDTTGTLIASSYEDPEIQIGSIFSTGCNAAYMEECGSIPKIKDYGLPDNLPIAINTEYGAFDNDRKVLPRTRFDCIIDESSPRLGQQIYEKMVAGLYLGEILRLVLIDLHDRSGFFNGQDISALRKPHVIDSAFLSTAEGDQSQGLDDIASIFNRDLGIKPAPHELKVSRYLVVLICTRAARLYACGIAAICKKKNIQSCHVGVDGSVFNNYPNFRERAAGALREILDWPEGTEDPVTLHSARDGSGVGAALIAALAMERSKGRRGGPQE
ncbi:Hexokinase [Rasamsonia emersonii CBS 393.64]|uniref:Phosphotransferase n=1 Tax=Rasamsonia emersonii (strain ATCC 16479 / CBS 393.64 / IMI 116815) TaxID=1408163 RepID=A0A0F4Z4E6_RASE3|nr:Hexokinase [Rasamsonia emersonii CBS 393.64]KKA25409.1 Hexokinase [Rasamsonia emersonii CBS 393.64]